MRNFSILRPFIWGFWALGGVACSTTERSTVDSITPAVYCRRACDAQHACDDSSDAAACTATCADQLADLTLLPRGDLLAYTARCAEDAACDATSSPTAQCTDEAIAVLAPTQAGSDFCTSYEQASNHCQLHFDQGACFEAAKSYPDAALTDASACTANARCSELAACLNTDLPRLSLPTL